MKRLILFLFVMCALGAHAALNLVTREPFVGPGTLTSASPGSNFSSVTGTFTLVRVGPRTSAIAAPGWSGEIQTPGSSVNYRGTINLTGAAATSGMWGAWVRIKALPNPGYGLSVLQLLNRASTNVVMDFNINSSGVISVTPYGGAVPFTSPAIPLNTWVWLGVAWQIQPQSGNNFPYGIRCLYMPLGGPLTIWGSGDGLNALDTSFSAVNVGLQTSVGGGTPMLRIGCPSLYSIGSFSDVAYPPDVIAPVEQSNNWYVNTVSGNDNNDGSTPATAWKTAAKLNIESQFCGMLDSNAAGPGGGDVLTIDTSGAPLVIGPNTLVFNTQGLKVQPASGQTYIKCQAEEVLANSGFTATPGLSSTYQTTDTQALVVAWQNDEWMWHVQASSFTSSAIVTNPLGGAVTNFASAGAALDATPGSFYTDGTTLYIHPFNSSNPATDGNVYTRSINRGGGLAAVEFSAGNYLANGFYVRKTALVDQNNNCFGAYCFQDGVLTGSGQNSEVENGYFAYGDKHCFGSTTGISASTLLVLNTECEQGHPYCSFGGQTPFVSFDTVTTADVVHTYKGCTCLTRSGLIGSAAGDPVGTGGDIILSHNGGDGGVTFASITIDDCNFASGSIDIGASNSLVVTDQTQTNGVLTGCPFTTISETTFTSQIIQMEEGSENLQMENCLIKPIFLFSTVHPNYYGVLLAGNVSIEGCTFDLSGITGDTGDFRQGMIWRTGPLNLTFRNNAYVVPAGQNFPLLYGALSSDTLTFDHNAYDLGGGTTLVSNYGSSGASLTLPQWQALGEDCINSTLNANLLLQNDAPQSGSPLFNAGVDLGAEPDVTGASYPHRNTIGAYEGSAAYLAPQSINGLTPLASASLGAPETLPSTTNAGLAVSYSVLSGPAQVSGSTLSFTGTGTVTLMATQAGNSGNAALEEIETITVSNAPPPVTDTPTLPAWALALLGVGLALVATRSRRLA